MRRLAAAGLFLFVAAGPARSQTPPVSEQVIDVQSSAALANTSFEALWTAYRRADEASDVDGARAVLQDLRWYRIERNIKRLETTALALCDVGLDRLKKGERERARDAFTRATLLDPYLPDAHFGLAMTALRQGPVGFPAAVSHAFEAVRAPLSSIRGRQAMMAFVTSLAFAIFLGTAFVVALAMLARYGTLLRHDLDEAFGGGALTLAIFLVLLALPVIALQGYGWLPFWWLALLFPYVGWLERIVAIVLLAVTLVLPPVVTAYERHAAAGRNPLFRAALLALESGPDSRAVADLEAATSQNRDDRDLGYLLATLYKKAARYEDAAAVYRNVLRADPKDAIALNNLANLEFARGDFLAAIARYKQATAAGSSDAMSATFYYNLSLAHLQRFEYDASAAARGQADGLDPDLVRRYEVIWKGERRGSAVGAAVDLGLSPEQVWTKFAGVAEGPGTKNVLAAAAPPSFDSAVLLAVVVNRFVAFALISALGVFLLNRWRGRNMFTMICQKCGTSFCKRCHLGAVVTGLCTQCHHLFVVRDGVSGPARNRKLLEVQKEEERRTRAFRILSSLVPGAGHVYAHRPLVGAVLAAIWCSVVSVLILSGRLPYTGASSRLVGLWGYVPHVLLLVLLYLLAHRLRPDFSFFAPAPAHGAPPRRSGRFA